MLYPAMYVVKVRIGGHVGCQRASQREEAVAATSAMVDFQMLVTFFDTFRFSGRGSEFVAYFYTPSLK